MHLKEESKLRNVLADRPLLSVLVFDVKFRVLFFMVVSLLILFGISIPKIWTVSPDHFTPEIKISILDILQSRSLERTARKATIQGNHRLAMFSWHAALANNPSRPVLYRGALTNSLFYPAETPRQIQAAVHQTVWLLKLARTNHSDLYLCSKVWRKLGFDHLTADLSSWSNQPLPNPLMAEEAMAHFRLGQWEEFNKRLGALKAGGYSSAELDLHEAAYRAMWGSGIPRFEGWKTIEEARRNEELRELANRLSLAVHSRNLDEMGFKDSLDALVSAGEAEFEDHLEYWLLLIHVGKADQARGLVKDLQQDALSPEAGIKLCRIQNLLKLEKQALETISSTTRMFPLSVSAWLERAKLLVSKADWNGLITAAYELKEIDEGHPPLKALASLFEAQALHNQSRFVSSRQILENLTLQTEFPGSISLYISNGMMGVGATDLALQWLQKLRPRMQDSIEFWHQLVTAAYRQKDADLLLQAAEKAYSIQPENLVAMNNYAAALLIKRQNASSALSLTLQLYQKSPSVESRVNHAIALSMNSRHVEALEILKEINPDLLPGQSASVYHYAMCVASCRNGFPAQAHQSLDKIDPDDMFPEQMSYLNELLPLAGPDQEGKGMN